MSTQYNAAVAAQFAERYTLPLETLRQRQTMKWQLYGQEVLPAWVAEMDFAPAPAISDVLNYWAQAQDTGYPWRQQGRADLHLAQAFSRYTQRQFDWQTDPNNVLAVNELVQAVYLLILAFSQPGDGVILQTPIYPPFYEAIKETGRRLQANPLRDNGQGYEIDFEDLSRQVDAGSKILVLCNPHNPSGRAFRRDELQKLADFAKAHQLLVISDEIHADLVFAGNQHLPFAAVAPELAGQIVTLTSASKSFNIAGLRCAVMYFGDGALLQRFTAKLPARILGYPSAVGIDATVAAWEEGGEWLNGVRHYLSQRREQVITTFQQTLPQVHVHVPDATYFTWLDFSALALPGSVTHYFREHARVALSPGESFVSGGEQFVRLNFATSQPILQKILGAIIDTAHR